MLEANVCTSLSENSRPDPIDQRKMDKDFDLKKYQLALTDMRQEFLSVKRLIKGGPGKLTVDELLSVYNMNYW